MKITYWPFLLILLGIFVIFAPPSFIVPPELQKNLTTFTAEESDYNYNDVQLQKIIDNIGQRAKTNKKKIREVSNYVENRLEYNLMSVPVCMQETASSVLNARTSDCVGYAKLTIALLRGLNVPAVPVVGCASNRVTCSDLFAVIPEERNRFPVDLPKERKYRGELHHWVVAWDGRNWVYLEPQIGGVYRATCEDYKVYQYNPNVGIDRCEMDSWDFAISCWEGEYV